MNRTISNTDDIIDSRDVIARIEELQEERDGCARYVYPSPDVAGKWGYTGCDQDCYATEEEAAVAAVAAWAVEYSEDAAELKALETLAEECEGYASDWRDGEALIRDSYFEDYARELAADCGDFPSPNEPTRWPFTCIDWEKAADELKQDYTSAEYGDETYWIRCS